MDERRPRLDPAESSGTERVRGDSGESSGTERVRVDSGDPDRVESGGSKRVRGEPDESDQDSPEVKRLRDDLLGLLDDLDPDPASQELYSVMKSFEDELSASSAPIPGQTTQPDLGYLLEASDDELGLPPPESKRDEPATELVRVSSDSSGIGDLPGFEDHMPSYDSFDLDIGDGYGPVDGLFEYSDVCFDSGDLSTWRPETFPAE